MISTKTSYRSIFVSDIHLGTRSCKAAELLDFLKHNTSDTLYLVGDIIDGWKVQQNKWAWNKTQSAVVRKFLKIADRSKVIFIPGNHDLYYRDKRDIQSVEWARHLPNVEICNDWFSSGDVIIAPWLVGDDHKRISKLHSKYMFGHFELPGYLMNAMVEMPDHGEVRREDFNNFEHVFTGHFHKRQTKKNITYIGNAFPHNYADAGDDERGLTILEWGQDPVYHAWPDQPRYRVLGLANIIDNAAALLAPRMHVRVNLDLEISYE